MDQFERLRPVACEALIAEHPSLSAIPVDDDTQQPYFARLPEVNLDHVVSFTQRQADFPGVHPGNSDPAPDLDLQALLETQHNIPFSASNAFWRLCILLSPGASHRFTAAFVFHHAIGDGNSGKAFHTTFVRALHAVMSTETKSLIKSPQTPLLPNIEAVHPLPLSFFYLAKKVFQAKIWSGGREPGLWTGSKIQPPSPTHLRLVPFPKQLVESLINRCRQERTTITAVLQTVVARSLFANLPAEFSRLNCSGALSCRRWLPDIITDDSMGVWVQDYSETYSRDNLALPSNTSFPWTEAQRSRQTIEAALAQQGRDCGVNLLKFVNDFQQELCLSKLGVDRDQSFEVSNIGVVRSESDPSRPEIRGMVFSQCAGVIGNAVQVSVATGGDGCLVLAFSWQDVVVEDELVDAVIGSVKDDLCLVAGYE
ncbi:hypothetical protein NUU61_007380 [Penicillium alfredii]|uniref:Alcohol acetyltransferase n=1 Tax=Penicillium alfredii TaxID=1506179 RepID=A0A9W9F2P5_9EURO|nr:uncharacterized protein NUU61_007380 [Penicillium alfredii]KAJ5092510.1 hypothetical protein NUU61_007380 [Penicillium alfredii]